MAPPLTGTSLIPHPPTEGEGSMNKIALFITVAATLFATSVAAQQDIGKNAKVTLVFDQELPNVPGKSLRVVLVEYGPGGGSPSHRHPSSAFIYARVLEGAIRSKVNAGAYLSSWRELDRAAGRSSPGQPECQYHGSGEAPGRLRGQHQRS
jgi:hypothetical protein